MSSDADLRDKIVRFHEWLAEVVPGAASWPWFGENEVRLEEFAAEAFRQGRSEVELKACMAMTISSALEKYPPLRSPG